MARTGAKKAIAKEAAKAPVYTPKKVAKPPAPTRSDGWDWWNEDKKVRQQPPAAASTGKWEWWKETPKEQESSDTSWSMVPTPQDPDEMMMPESKKQKPPDGAVGMSLEAQLLDSLPPSGTPSKKGNGGMTCAHAPSASTAAA
eukprot:5446956-Amphidinium_carterae.1